MSGDSTEHFNIPYLAANQSQPNVTVDEAFDVIDDALFAAGSITVEDLDASPPLVATGIKTLRFANATVIEQTDGSVIIALAAGASDQGGSPLTVEDYAASPGRVVTDVSTIKFINATVTEQTGGVAIVTIPTSGGGGGGSAGNVTPDSHPATTNAANDEFETGSTLDTTGARFSGATSWVVKNALSTTNSLKAGSILFGGSTGNINDNTVYSQAIASPSAVYEFTTKLLGDLAGAFIGLFIGTGSTGKGYYFGLTGGSLYVVTQTTYAGASVTSVFNTASAGSGVPIYLKVSYDLTNLNFAVSFDGIQFQTLYSATPASFIGSAPNTIGLMFGAGASPGSGFNTHGAIDWFRRTA